MTAKKAASIQGALGSNEERHHASTLCDQLATATRFTCIVAFARMSGFNLISKPLAARIAAGMSATFVVGIDFFQTEPDLLEALLRLKKTAKSPGKVKIYIGAENRQFTMHPKVYLFARKDGANTAVIGSANMTYGGFQGNHEFSAVMSGREVHWEADLNKWIDLQVAAGEVVEVSNELVARYANLRDVYLPYIKIAERQARKALTLPLGNPDTLRAILVAMKADKGDDGFVTQVLRRAAAYREAAAVLKEIAQQESLAEDKFLELYEPLVSRLWHSGGLQRAKTTIARNAPIFQEA